MTSLSDVTYEDARRYFDYESETGRLRWKVALSCNMPAGKIDHIDRDKGNNRIENLRDVSASINQPNTEAIGGCLHKSSGLWWAQITITRVSHSLGYFHTKEEAIAAYKKARQLYYPDL